MAIGPPSSPGSIVHANGAGRITEPPLVLFRPKTSRNRRPPDIPLQVPSIQIHPSVLALPPSEAIPHACWLRRLVSTAVLWGSYQSWLFFEGLKKHLKRVQKKRSAFTLLHQELETFNTKRSCFLNLISEAAPRIPLSLFPPCPSRSMSTFFAESVLLLLRQGTLSTEGRYP